MIILHPDFLVSSTVVADSFSCVRKAVFQDRVKATGDISKPMVYGNILHSLFQIPLEANDFSTAFLRKSIDSLVVQYVESLYMLKEPLPVATEYLCSKIHLIQDWANLFVSKKPKANAFVTEHRTRYNPIVAITKLLDIEEHVWSPMFGLKGMIDATVQATIVDHKSEKVLTIPLEFKTGKSTTVMMHRAQTMLYTLLMSDRYDIDVQCGLLYYLENKEMIRVPAIRDELRGMIIGRNRLASYIRNREVLPDMLKSRYTCGNCYAKETCFIYHKLLEDGTPKTSGVEDHFHDMTGHLGKSHQKFFGHWDNLLSKEEKDISRFRKELWGLLSSEREALGRCFGQLVIVPGSISVDSSASKINRYTYSLTKGEGTAVPGFTFLDSMINPGEPIVISDEKGHFALALGYITEIRHNRVTVQVDRRLHNARTRKPGFNRKTNQVFAGIMEVSKDGEEQDLSQSANSDEGIRYRLDKDEFSNGMASVRNNLVQIMSPKSNEKYRKLLVDLEPPVFKISPTAYSVDSSSQTNLNGDQRKAIEKVMSARDYALVLGMPGTGKTTTIAHIIRALVGQGKSVLLTSYTHTAVDNILLKIKSDNIDTLRLGSGTKVIHKFKLFTILLY
ncbi:DNA replication factor Dna2-domain-containing protein [Tuber brumale]|nr:DNA replication factor Dna2-domain-containing protein [Tuber brumale]